MTPTEHSAATDETHAPWLCHARPAPGGRPCGHLNETPTLWRGYHVPLLVCAGCGCTKLASDAREERATRGASVKAAE